MIKLAPELAQAIHNYLVTRPMHEVEGMVNALRQCKAEEPEISHDHQG